jgi:hypothetical protein
MDGKWTRNRAALAGKTAVMPLWGRQEPRFSVFFVSEHANAALQGLVHPAV